jgi:hypothetical protein
MRKGPEESATMFSIGIKKKGNDGNIWSIVKNKNGVKRWKKTQKKRKKTNKTRKIFKSKLKNVGHEKKISVKILKSFKKKYSVTTTGNKEEIAEGLWRVSGRSMSDDDLLLIIPLLSKRDRNEAEKLLSKRITEPVINYKGMWMPQPKPLRKMSRKEMIKHLRNFRNAWESYTGNQDLSDERLDEESLKSLRRILKFYYSNKSKQLAAHYLRDYQYKKI